MILSGNYSLWFGEWHWNNNQESCRVPQSLKIIQKWTKRKGKSLEAQANILQAQKWQRWQTALPWGSVNPRLQPHLSYSSYAPAVRATTKVSQRWGLCCNLWFPQSTLGDDFGEHQYHPHRYMKMIVRSKGLQVPSNITGKSCQTREKPIKMI